jgi:hypothetical protein
MFFLRIDPWPAGLALAVAIALIVAMRAIERYARSVIVHRTRRDVQRALKELEPK